MSLLKVLLLSFSVFLIACGGDGESEDNPSRIDPKLTTGDGLASDNQETIESDPVVTITDPVEKSIYTVSGRYAVYYSKEAPASDNPEAGADASDPEITRTKIAEEPVDTFRLNYSWDEFHDIESENFNVVWSGDIDVDSPKAITYLTINSGRSLVSVNVDGQRYFSESDCSPCIVTLELDQGSHSFEIDIHNHWHTTDASALFTDQPPAEAELITTRISTPAANVFVLIDIYESKNLNSSVVIEIPEGDKKITIFAHSYRGVRWQLQGATERVDGFYYSSFEASSETFEIDKSTYLGYRVSSSSITDLAVREIFSKPVSYKYANYGADTIQLVLDQTTNVDEDEDEVIIFDNLQGIVPITRIAESSLNRQEIATKFSVAYPVLLKHISWIAWSEQRTEDSDFFGSIRSKTYTVSIYSGDIIPSSFETFEVVRAQARFFYSTELGDVYSMEAEFEANHVLQPGTYWISMQHHDSSGPRYSVVLKTEGSLQGGVFRNDDTADWVHIDGTLNSPGVSMSLSGLK